MKITILPSILIGALTFICNVNARPMISWINTTPKWIGHVALTPSDLQVFSETFTPEVLELDTKNVISEQGTTATIYPVKKFTKSRTGKSPEQLVAKVFTLDMSESAMYKSLPPLEAKALKGIDEIEGTGRIKLPGENKSRIVIIELKKDGKMLLGTTELGQWHHDDSFMKMLRNGYCGEVAKIAEKSRFLHYDGTLGNVLYTFKTSQDRPVIESVSIVDWGTARWVQEPLPTEEEVKAWCLKQGVFFN